MRVFKNKFGHWTTLFKNKILNGEEIKYYMPVQFQKGGEPMKDSIDIEPTRWWGSCYLSKVTNNGIEEHVAKPKIFIAEWEEELPTPTPDNDIDRSIEEYKAQNYTDYMGKQEDNGDIDIKADDLPFY